MQTGRSDHPEHALQRSKGDVGLVDRGQTRADAAHEILFVLGRHAVGRLVHRLPQRGSPLGLVEDELAALVTIPVLAICGVDICCAASGHGGTGSQKCLTQKIAATPLDLGNLLGTQEVFRRCAQPA
ncbi:hypothetical protein GALL_422890 [mine drainage metagenome]|uniref:Uncharacterized protein n=1 Tax=mine drainage metagenome TaxID=410659 RepID=A0A1J5QET9_9ZZZZ